MKLRVDDISVESRDLSFAEPEQELNRALAYGPSYEYQLTHPVIVRIAYYRAGTELFLEGTVAADTRANCARCAEEFATSTSRRFRYVLAPRVIGEDAEAALRQEDLEFTMYDGAEIDLGPMVREQVLLALAERPLCREDCEGLCPHCGANLNQQRCECREDRGDPRFAALRNLKVGRG
jgi:uncharacterized protein